MKIVDKMIEPMKNFGYHYCPRHDVYFDEWLECPACALEIILSSLDTVQWHKDNYKKLIQEFDPKDRD